MTNLYFLFFFSLFFSLKPYFSFSRTNSISLTSSLRSNQTLISKQEKFELGFFKPSQKPITDPHSSQLKISNDGNLVLLNSSSHQIWSTNTASKVTHAILSDTSNLILKNGSGSIVWQSFDHPGNTLMPGVRFGYNKITRQYTDITCWESPDNPAPAPFTMRFDPDGSNQYIMWWNGSEIYWWSGLWTGTYFMQLPNVAFSNPLKIKLTFTNTYDGKYVKYTLTENSIIARIILNSDGQYQISHWLNNIKGWQPYSIQPVSQCDVYSVCGPYGICDTTKTIPCSCIKGFEPLHEKDWESNDFNKVCV
ncbi:hypothetical protein LUZ60_010644 [Juncus effusus]|nr:hypothetical protein LUZ60_010644 [Juncus effusus]